MMNLNSILMRLDSQTKRGLQYNQLLVRVASVCFRAECQSCNGSPVEELVQPLRVASAGDGFTKAPLLTSTVFGV